MAYNGWTNYETWAVKLWMDNDESTANWIEEDIDPKPTAYDLAKLLKEEYNEERPLQENCVWSDLLQNALDCVNWHEIAEALLADYNDEGDDEDE